MKSLGKQPVNRRQFLAMLGAGAVVTAAGLWMPGAKLISIPKLLNTSYPPGDIRRYGAVQGEDCTDAIIAAFNDPTPRQVGLHIPSGKWDGYVVGRKFYMRNIHHLVSFDKGAVISCPLIDSCHFTGGVRS